MTAHVIDDRLHRFLGHKADSMSLWHIESDQFVACYDAHLLTHFYWYNDLALRTNCHCTGEL